MQFDWEHRRPPERLTFGFYFDPILPRLRECYWLCEYWPLAWPTTPEAEQVLASIELPLTPPDTVLPKLARQIVGDRDQFFGLRRPPDSPKAFYERLQDAGAADIKVWEQFAGGASIATKAFERAQQRYLSHIRANGTHTDRFLDPAGVDYAFVTNDSVWWYACRNPAASEALKAYAARVPGLTFSDALAFAI